MTNNNELLRLQNEHLHICNEISALTGRSYNQAHRQYLRYVRISKGWTLSPLDVHRIWKFRYSLGWRLAHAQRVSSFLALSTVNVWTKNAEERLKNTTGTC
jgi:hypothetical protein